MLYFGSEVGWWGGGGLTPNFMEFVMANSHEVFSAPVAHDLATSCTLQYTQHSHAEKLGDTPDIMSTTTPGVCIHKIIIFIFEMKSTMSEIVMLLGYDQWKKLASQYSNLNGQSAIPLSLFCDNCEAKQTQH